MTPGETVPLAAAGLWHELVDWLGLGHHAEPPRVRDIADRFGMSCSMVVRWLNVLEGAGFITRGTEGGTGVRRSITINAETARDKRFRPCLRCYRRERDGPGGKWCMKCKQKMRSDRRWRASAIRMAKQGHGEMAIYLALSKRFPEANVTLYDRAGDEETRGSPGVISVLAAAGLASGAWVEGQEQRGGTSNAQRKRRSK